MDYPISLSYTGSKYVAGVEATNKLTVFTLLGKYNLSPKLTVAGKFLVPKGVNKTLILGDTFALGGPMGAKLAATCSMVSGTKKEKMNKAPTFECAVTATPLKGLKTGSALAFSLANPGKYKYGLTFALG